MAAVPTPPLSDSGDPNHARLLEAMVEERTRALREAQSRLAAIIENEPECVKVLDAEGRLLEMNAAGLRMIEADSVTPLLGKSVYALVAPEHRAAFRDLTERVCRGERAILEFEIVGLKGSRRWMETHAAPFHEEASGRTRLLGITRDVTERKRAELALRASEQRFRSLTELSSDWYWEQDENFRFVMFSPGVEGAAGSSIASHFGKTRWELPVVGVGEEQWASHRAALNAHQPFRDFEYQRVNERGDTIWMSASGAPIFDENGRFRGYRGIGRNITAQKGAEQALRESEERFRSFMENSPAVAWFKDAKLRYRYISGPYEREVAIPAAEMLGRDDFEIWPGETARNFRRNDEQVIATGRPIQTIEPAARPPDGQVRQWLVIKFPLPDAEGRTGVGGMGIDITERVQAEERASIYAEGIRNLMKRLIDAQESERRRLADNLHDLIGQNLTALGIELGALKTLLPPQPREHVAPRLDAMSGLLNGTVESIRGVMTDLRPPALEEYGLVPAMRWYATVFSERTGIKVSTSVSVKSLRLPRDSELALFRILQEALTNAAKHSGGTCVEIAVTEHEGGIRLSVEDDGRGFDDPVGARSARRGGWGLPTMRERAEAHGGKLRIEFPDRGTRVIVEMPGAHAD